MTVVTHTVNVPCSKIHSSQICALISHIGVLYKLYYLPWTHDLLSHEIFVGEGFVSWCFYFTCFTTSVTSKLHYKLQ
jgi:hypothetical protein